MKTIELKVITREELDDILAKHKEWLLDNKTGQRADLSYNDLRGFSFECANLQEVNFECANLYEACLRGGDLQSTNFKGANLRKANLEQTN